MSDLRDIYQQVILDHNRSPRNFRVIEPADHQADGYNPLCGDRVTLYVKMKDDVIEDVAFQGAGCAISTASASMLTESLRGKTRAEAEEIFQNFRLLVTEGATPDEANPDEVALGKLAVFGGVAEFPMRVKCATLCWHTFHTALAGGDEAVSTE